MATVEAREGRYAGVMPDMAEEEFEALKQSIEENGFDGTQPIVVDGDGVIVDGHHRFQACRELDVEPEVVTVEGASAEQAYRRNLARRDLHAGEKRDVVRGYLEEHYGGERTQAEVAADLGVSQATVSRALKDIHPNKLSREEKRERVAEYLNQNPGVPNREVAENAQCDVSHTAVGNWRDEWEAGEDSEASGAEESQGEEQSTDTGTVVAEVSGPAKSADDNSGDSEGREAGQDPPEEEPDTSASETESVDESESSGPDGAGEAKDEENDQREEVKELREENERLQTKLLEAAELRENVKTVRSSVDAARNRLDGHQPDVEGADAELETAQDALEAIDA